MNLILDLSQRLDDATLSPSERASLQCQIAGEFETAGDYESARQAMNGVWQRIGERPRLDGLENQVKGVIELGPVLMQAEGGLPIEPDDECCCRRQPDPALPISGRFLSRAGLTHRRP